MLLKIGVHISKVIFRLILTLLFYWNRSSFQEFNNLEKVILLSKRTGQLFQELCIQKSSHWGVFLKIGAHISQLYPDWCEHSYFIGTGLFPRGQQIWKVMLLSKEQIISSRKFVYTFFCLSAKYHRLSRNSVVLQLLIFLENSFIFRVMKI